MSRLLIVLMFFFFIPFGTYSQERKLISSFLSQEVDCNKNGWAYWFIPSGGIADTLSVKMSYVNKGVNTHTPHKHKEDELFYLLEGQAKVHLNGEEKDIKAGDSFYAPGNSLHNISRVDTINPIKYLMFKRETPNGISRAYLPLNKNYTIDDCLSLRELMPLKDTERWCLKRDFTNDGLNAKFCILSKNSLSEFHDKDQMVCFVLEGNVIIMIDGCRYDVEALSSCYIPAGSICEIQAVGNSVEYLLVKTN